MQLNHTNTNDCLIGHSGFVGTTLSRLGHYAARFRSTDIASIAGRSFDTVVCAGALRRSGSPTATPRPTGSRSKASSPT